jgi:hypothetical protein
VSAYLAARPGLKAILLAVLSGFGLGSSCPAALGVAPQGVLDNRAWEMVSPVEKNGGEVGAPGSKGAGVIQAAAGGGALAFGSNASFGEAQGAPPISQYLSARGEGGWETQNLSPSLLSGTYSGDPYLLFSPELSRALLTNGWSCRDGGGECEAENPPLSADAPPGYRNLYLREGSTYTPLITNADSALLATPPSEFELAFEGASPDLRHVAFSAVDHLYEWSEGTLAELSAVTGAALAAPSGAISADGSRLYFTQEGKLYLREGASTVQVDQAQGGGGSFQTASDDGSVAYYTKEGHLYRYDAVGKASQDLTPAGEVQGVLGAAADGSYLYYLGGGGLFAFHEGTSTKVAAAADATNYPPATGTARVTPDGTRLLFLSKASLTGYANVGKAEVFLYEAPAKKLICVSCNPKGTTPAGPSSIPGAIAPAGAPPTYKPRALTAEGTRVFFDSADALLFTDSDGRPDAYEWGAKGAGGCTKAVGCLSLISGGRAGEAAFLDASTEGSDAYFLTEASLLPADIGSRDVYDARAGGGFPESPPQLPCEGDDCQGPPSGPDDPTPGTAILEGPVNPPIQFAKKHHRKKHHHHRRRHHRHHGGKR